MVANANCLHDVTVVVVVRHLRVAAIGWHVWLTHGDGVGYGDGGGC